MGCEDRICLIGRPFALPKGRHLWEILEVTGYGALLQGVLEVTIRDWIGDPRECLPGTLITMLR